VVQGQEVLTDLLLPGIKLFQKNNNIENIKQFDWHRYLKGLLIEQLVIVEEFLSGKVSKLKQKLKTLINVLESKYEGNYSLIHGDYCPSNIMINEENKVSGIIDFGVMTMRGDYLFDVATGWLFFDMYGEYGFDFRSKYYQMIIKILGERVKGKIALYVLLYSIYSINFYSKDYSDGHAAWCIKNLNDDTLWGNFRFF